MKYLIYVTKAKPYLFKDIRQFECMDGQGNSTGQYVSYFNGFELDKENFGRDYLNGKIVAEFEGECEEMFTDENGMSYYTDTIKEDYMVSKLACLDDSDIDDYLEGNIGYAIRIKNLKVFNKPLKLKEVYRKNLECKWQNGRTLWELYPLTKAPQNMMWVWYKGEKYCLISIRSGWSCDILNGIKTIEIRRKVLKECL